MAQKRRIKYIDVNVKKDSFISKLAGNSKSYTSSNVKSLKNLLSGEKARILYTIKFESPKSIYSLSKSLNRDFKSVSEDVRLLEKFGLIELKSVKTGKRKSLEPRLSAEKLQITINI